ncbi:MAG: septation protein A [Lautropia sp.]
MQKLLFDLFPIILFFAAFKFFDIYVATGVAIAATIGQIAWLKLRNRKVDTMQWISLVVIVVFGGLTLFLHDETFIKWKPTILYWAFGATILGARLFGRNLIRTLMGQQIALPDAVWDRLALAWIAFFGAMGALNLWVAYGFSTDQWVNFKLFGTLGLTVVFILAQGVYLSRHVKEPQDG